ncbi:hypothetical protein RintRC_6065 [Richelia intracellularis]|nr:hypothetical protein RintRC_6065 [Richelia intracellularis]
MIKRLPQKLLGISVNAIGGGIVDFLAAGVSVVVGEGVGGVVTSVVGLGVDLGVDSGKGTGTTGGGANFGEIGVSEDLSAEALLLF